MSILYHQVKKAEPRQETAFNFFDRFPHYINPIEVKVQEAMNKKLILGERLSKVKQFFPASSKKLRRMSRRLPAVFRAAWRELNPVD